MVKIPSPLSATTSSNSRRAYVLLAALVLVAAALPRLWAALADHSLFWCDEIHQSLEPAHRALFGYGFVPWEYRVGARSWLFRA
jgi:GPI mannosyltransferase 3